MVFKSPLEWPLGYPRTAKPVTNYNFREWSFDESKKDLNDELKLLKAERAYVSTNIPVKKDGQFHYNWRDRVITDKAVAVYFVLDGQQRVLCCDAWDNFEDNMHAIALTIAALRGLVRWKCSDILKRTFQGLKELPETTVADVELWEILKLEGKPSSRSELDAAYKQQAKVLHPDVPGGSEVAFTALNEAYRKAKQLVTV